MIEIHVGDTGTKFSVAIKDQNGAIVDLSSATKKEIIFKKPDKTVVTETAQFGSDGHDGVLAYITTSSTLDVVGSWQIQGHVILPTGEWRSDIQNFIVHKNLV